MIGMGIVSISMAVVGLWYNLTTLFTNFSSLVQEYDIPHFYPAFYTMSTICIGCYLVLYFLLDLLESLLRIMLISFGTVQIID